MDQRYWSCPAPKDVCYLTEISEGYQGIGGKILNDPGRVPVEGSVASAFSLRGTVTLLRWVMEGRNCGTGPGVDRLHQTGTRSTKEDRRTHARRQGPAVSLSFFMSEDQLRVNPAGGPGRSFRSDRSRSGDRPSGPHGKSWHTKRSARPAGRNADRRGTTCRRDASGPRSPPRQNHRAQVQFSWNSTRSSNITPKR
jgi:hypothetical protein